MFLMKGTPISRFFSKPETVKLLEENRWWAPWHQSWWWFWGLTPKVKETKVETKVKTKKWELKKPKSFCPAQETINKMNNLLKEKIFANHISNNGLMSKIYKALTQLNSKKTKQPNSIIKWTEDMNRQLSKEDIRWPLGTWKDVQWQEHRNMWWDISAGPGKTAANKVRKTCRPQPWKEWKWDITSHLLEWLKSKPQETTSVDEDVGEKEPSCIAGENANWCSLCGKQYGSLSKN